ncbi:MAG: NAD(P)H-dependent oxidoreductase subunit E [bacterium]
MSKPTEAQTEFTLSIESRQRIQTLRERYPTRQSALMPALWVIQDELGYIPQPGVDWLVQELGVTAARVWELITFYTMYRSEPQAEYVLQVCRNISCHIMGARNIIAHLEKRLGIRLGETTPDGKFALEGVECLGACGHGPALQLGKHLYEFLTPAKVDLLLDSLKQGKVPRADTDREVEE